MRIMNSGPAVAVPLRSLFHQGTTLTPGGRLVKSRCSGHSVTDAPADTVPYYRNVIAKTAMGRYVTETERAFIKQAIAQGDHRKPALVAKASLLAVGGRVAAEVDLVRSVQPRDLQHAKHVQP